MDLNEAKKIGEIGETFFFDKLFEISKNLERKKGDAKISFKKQDISSLAVGNDFFPFEFSFEIKTSKYTKIREFINRENGLNYCFYSYGFPLKQFEDRLFTEECKGTKQIGLVYDMRDGKGKYQFLSILSKLTIFKSVIENYDGKNIIYFPSIYFFSDESLQEIYEVIYDVDEWVHAISEEAKNFCKIEDEWIEKRHNEKNKKAPTQLYEWM